MLALAFSVQPVKAEGTVYIRPDGSVYPPTAPIQRNGSIYTLTGNIVSDGDGIVVQKNNVTVDGANHTLQGSGWPPATKGHGFDLTEIDNVTIKKTKITSFLTGVCLLSSSNSNVSGNNIADTRYGIYFDSSSGNTVSGNNITSSYYEGIGLSSSFSNAILDNNIIDGEVGIVILSSSNSTVSGNNLSHNVHGIVSSSSSNSIVSGNTITSNNYYGVRLRASSNSNISDNNIARNDFGIGLDSSSNCNTVSGNDITANMRYGIVLSLSSINTILGNNVANNWEADVVLDSSSGNIVSGNNITSSYYEGIGLSSSSNNTVSGNDITANNRDGMWLNSSSNNRIYHNSFSNTYQVYSTGSVNVWDDGHPSGGNYWSDYLGVDVKSGPGRDLPGSDGIGDVPYVIDANNTDQYPLIYPSGAPPHPTHSLAIVPTVGGMTDPAFGTYSYVINSTVQITALPEADYRFGYWELDGANIDSANSCSVLTDKDHTLKAVFLHVVAATADIPHQALNLESRGDWIVCYIEFPEGHNVSDIDVSAVLLNGTIPADLDVSAAIGDYDGDGIADLALKFNRTEVVEYMLSRGIQFDNVTIALTGKLCDDTLFEARSVMRVSALASDVNCDGKVGIYDIVVTCASYGSREDEPNWNPNANFALSWNRIDIFDLVTIISHYGQERP
jgi:parallel beta-helix repeat protein